MWTKKQYEFINQINYGIETYNGKIGATRSGKTYLDLAYGIAKRTRSLKGKDGLYVIMGVTADTVERNLLEPMRNIWGDKLVGTIKDKSRVMLFGELYHVVGHEKITAVSRIQGMSIKYCYIDEIVNMNKETFEMLHSRLDQEYSVLDFTGNPDNPNHFIYKWLKDEANEQDIFMQTYTIDDNKYLDERVIERLKRQYEGTVNYQRYILGQWTVAEGSIYPMLRKDIHFIDWENHDLKERAYQVNVGVDIGGNKSKTSFNATAIIPYQNNTRRIEYIVTIKDRRFEEEKDVKYIESELLNFIQDIEDAGYQIRMIRVDNAEQVILRSIHKAVRQSGRNTPVKGALKKPILERIRTYQRLLNLGRYLISNECKTTYEAFEQALWSDKQDANGKDRRLDDGTTNIDTLDAQEYSTEELHDYLI